jgi:hydroxyacylglutathione hydrolase
MVVDPRRDVDVYLDAAAADGVRITHVAETHLHNDYVSGARDLALLTGATHLIGAGAELGHEHRPVRDGESWEVGTLRFSALDTPGHTPEHVAYALADTSRADEPIALFTGGSLLVGAVGRTDLLGADQAENLGRAMFRSLHNAVLAHEDFVGVYPTHGAGSLCSTGISATPSTTIGFERRYNSLLRHEDAETFVRALLHGQPAFPGYFARMRPTNRAGPALLGGRLPELTPVAPAAGEKLRQGGALVVDLRAPEEHAAGHVPGSVSIPSGDSFGTWLGWVVEPDRPILLLLPAGEDGREAMRQIVRIGFEPSVVGRLDGGWAAWQSAALPVERGELLTVDALAGRIDRGGSDAPVVIDVRQAGEYESGHVPGSHHLLAADLPGRLAELPRDRPIATICASGFRASIGASLLRQAGFERVASVDLGVPAWASAGYPVETGGLALPSANDASDGAHAAEAGHRH